MDVGRSDTTNPTTDFDNFNMSSVRDEIYVQIDFHAHIEEYRVILSECLDTRLERCNNDTVYII
jgi:hypothetical protein